MAASLMTSFVKIVVIDVCSTAKKPFAVYTFCNITAFNVQSESAFITLPAVS